MTQTQPLFLTRCTVALRAITRRDAVDCDRLVADHAAHFEAARAEPSIGRAVRLGCVTMLERHGAASSDADATLGIAAAVARQVAAETRRGESPLGARARAALGQG